MRLSWRERFHLRLICRPKAVHSVAKEVRKEVSEPPSLTIRSPRAKEESNRGEMCTLRTVTCLIRESIIKADCAQNYDTQHYMTFQFYSFLPEPELFKP